MFHGWRDVTEEQVTHVLGQIKELFADQTKWMDWPIALDVNKQEVAPQSKEAVTWSLMGASLKFAMEKYPAPLCHFVDCALRDYLGDLSGDFVPGKMETYTKEYELICTGHDLLSKKES